MVYIKKIATLSALALSVAMYGSSHDEWIVVGKRKKNTITTTDPKTPRLLTVTSTDSIRTTKKAKKFHSPSVNVAHIPSLACQPLLIKPASLPPKPTSASKIVTHISAIQRPIRSYDATPGKPIYEDIPLHMAALHDDVTEIKNLIAEKADICALDANGATALHWAAGNGKTAAIQTILNYEDGIACIGIQDCEGKTPLHRAAGIKSDAILVLLEKAPKEFIDLCDKDGSTALLWAASGGRLPAVKALLKKGAYVDAQDDVRGRTPLHWTLRMRKGSPEKGGELMPAKTSQAIIKSLTEHNANPNIRDFAGFSSLDWARQLKLHTEITLLENKPIELRRSERIRNRR